MSRSSMTEIGLGQRFRQRECRSAATFRILGFELLAIMLVTMIITTVVLFRPRNIVTERLWLGFVQLAVCSSLTKASERGVVRCTFGGSRSLHRAPLESIPEGLVETDLSAHIPIKSCQSTKHKTTRGERTEKTHIS